LRAFVQEAAKEYEQEHSLDMNNKQINLSILIEKVNWLRVQRIPNI